jgi:glycosyltransferase involved in cell wall biosynthesis
MDILITCYRLDLTGSSTYTLTLAVELKNRGHSVAVFSPFSEVIADEMRKQQISVYKNLQELASGQFSFIIAQHNILAVMVRSIMPEVPMIFICHGKLLPQAYLEQPPPIDIDIRKYIAVSERIRDHLIFNHRIPSHCVETVRNFVDTQKFLPRGEISQTPGVVLLLSNRCTHRIYKTVKGACRKLSLKLITIGGNRQVINVEDYINKADLVISLGLGILEAMACGRAAIVYGYLGGDGMITQDNIDLLKKANFSGRVFQKNYNVEDLIREIKKYHWSMGKTNRAIVLREYNVSTAADKIIDICNDVLNTFCPRPVCIGEINQYLNQSEHIFPFVCKRSNYGEPTISPVCHKIINRIFLLYTKIKHFANVTFKKTKKALCIFAMLARVFSWLLFSPNPRRFSNVWITFKAGGLRACYRRAVESFFDTYRTYHPGSNELTLPQSRHILSFKRCKPLISILVVLHPAASARLIRKCIDSVRRQHYDKWEIILLAEKISKASKADRVLESMTQQDHRIRLCCTIGTTAGAKLNEGLKFAKGQFIGFLEPQDKLPPDALTWLVWAINSNPDAVWFYSDEDRISAIIGRRHTPNFKPDFSMELLLSTMQTGHFSVYSADILLQAKGFTELADIDPYHDLALRIAETHPRKNIIHIPRVLYHQRDYRPSNDSRKHAELISAAGCNAVRQSLKRRNLKAQVTQHPLCRTLYQIELEPKQFPKVSIIIAAKNNPELLRKCLTALRNHTCYPDYEIIIIDNQSDDPAFYELLGREQMRIVRYDKPFNHSDMHNTAIDLVQTDWIVLMNNDVEILSERWLEQMVATAQMDKSIAAVGGLLLYPNGTVQHGGIILGIRGIAGHAHKYMDAQKCGYFGRLHALQEYSGVTAALSLIRKSVGGFNATRYPTSFNDVDLCIRLKQNGFRCIYNPMIRAMHYELKTRPITKDELIFRQRLAEDHYQILNNDPFYNPNLSLSNEQFHGFREFPIEYQIPELCDYPPQCCDSKETI